MALRVGTFLFCVAVLVAPRFWKRANGGLEILFLDVGQGDSTMIRFPEGSTWLIDAGGGFDRWNVGQAEVFPELARQGILNPAVAVLTHPDQDHAFGFTGLFEEMKFGEFWFAESAQRLEKPLLNQLRESARQNGTAERAISRRTKWQMGPASAEVIALSVGSATNNNCLVVAIDFRGCRVLITGDIEAAAEKVLLSSQIGKADLLKVAHHGSRTSSTPAFLNAAKPRWAVISVGVHNTYGHPHGAVVERLRRAGAKLWRTDFHGYVKFAISDEGRVTCTSGVGDCGFGACGESWSSLRALKSE